MPLAACCFYVYNQYWQVRMTAPLATRARVRRFRPPAFVGFGFSAVAPRPDPIGQFLPHQEHRPDGLLHGLRQLASTILFDYFAINSPGCAVAVATSHPDVFSSSPTTPLAAKRQLL